MSNENRRPWYRSPAYLGVIVAIVAIVVSIIVWRYPNSPPDFSISVNPMRGEVQQGCVIFTVITVKGEHRYKESVSLSASGQPSGVVVTFAPTNGKPAPTFTSNMILNVGLDVPIDSYEIMTTGIGADGKEHSCKYILRVISEPVITPLTPAEKIETKKIEVQEYKYAATKDSEVFHYINCFYVARIKPENLILFKTREEAIASGRRPCKICKP